MQVGSTSTPTTPVYTAPPLFARYANYHLPPVPQLPEPYRFAGVPSPSPASDVFHTAPSSPTSPSYSKPLPTKPKSINGSEEEIEQALASSPGPERTIKPHGHSRGNGSTSSARRRSASVGDIERTKSNPDAPDRHPPPGETPRSVDLGKTSTEWDTNGIINMFKGELFQLDPSTTTSLEITDPSHRTNQNRPRATTDLNPSSRAEGTGTIRPRASGTSSRPSVPNITTVTDRTDNDSPPAKRSPVSPKRFSFNHPDSPIRSATRRTVSRPSPPIAASAMYAASPRTVSTPMLSLPQSSTPPGKSWNSSSPIFSNPFTPQPSVFVNGASSVGNRDPSQTRSPASHSEPVLVPGGSSELGPRRNSQPHTSPKTPDINRTVRLVPSTTSFAYPNGQASTSASQVDIVDGFSGKSVASSSMSPARGASMDGEDLEARGQELAKRCWMDDETFLPREKIAEWLGGA